MKKLLFFFVFMIVIPSYAAPPPINVPGEIIHIKPELEPQKPECPTGSTCFKPHFMTPPPMPPIPNREPRIRAAPSLPGSLPKKSAEKQCKSLQNQCLYSVTRTISNCNNTYNTQNEQLLLKGLPCHGQHYKDVARDAEDEFMPLAFGNIHCQNFSSFNDLKNHDFCFSLYMKLGRTRCAKGVPEITRSTTSGYQSGLVFKILGGGISETIKTTYKEGEGSFKICDRLKNKATAKCANSYNDCMSRALK